MKKNASDACVVEAALSGFTVVAEMMRIKEFTQNQNHCLNY